MCSDARTSGRTEERQEGRRFTRIYLEWAEKCHRQASVALRKGSAVPPQRDRIPLLRDLLDCFSPGDRSFVSRALTDPYFPVTMTARTHLRLDCSRFPSASPEKLEKVKMNRVAGLSRMFLRLRSDIAAMETHGRVSSMRLTGRMDQSLPWGQWCTFCGECCRINGVNPAPPPGIVYPGHWLDYISGDTPIPSEFCVFQFEYFGLDRYFCSIHAVKPLACRKYEREHCLSAHPGKADAGGGDVIF